MSEDQTNQDQPTIQLGNYIYDINSFNQRGLQIVDRLLTIQKRVNEYQREFEIAEITRNALQQTLTNHIQEVGYEPLREVESSDDAANTDG